MTFLQARVPVGVVGFWVCDRCPPGPNTLIRNEAPSRDPVQFVHLSTGSRGKVVTNLPFPTEDSLPEDCT